jgi:hypothetical protein
MGKFGQLSTTQANGRLAPITLTTKRRVPVVVLQDNRTEHRNGPVSIVVVGADGKVGPTNTVVVVV